MLMPKTRYICLPKGDVRWRITCDDMQYGYTPLHCASSEGNIAVIRRLLEYGADAEIQSNVSCD
jgi:ankyrin repeat protein